MGNCPMKPSDENLGLKDRWTLKTRSVGATDQPAKMPRLGREGSPVPRGATGCHGRANIGFGLRTYRSANQRRIPSKKGRAHRLGASRGQRAPDGRFFVVYTARN